MRITTMSNGLIGKIGALGAWERWLLDDASWTVQGSNNRKPTWRRLEIVVPEVGYSVLGHVLHSHWL